MTVRTFTSTALEPLARGLEFGTVNRDRIRANIAIYRSRFDSLAGGRFDVTEAGLQALAMTENFAPALHAEMMGLAQGAEVPPHEIGALNARTEVLGLLRAKTRGECSTVIHVPAGPGAPAAVQTWDWYCLLKDSWLHWTIPQADGSTTRTMTEYGIVGKAGMNTRGIGLLFTILHHAHDGQRIGVPVHVTARAILDGARSITHAAQIAVSARVSASSSINLCSFEKGNGHAITVELNPDGPAYVLPDANGYLIHTNHFLAAEPARHDTEPGSFPDTLLRHAFLTRRLSGTPHPSTEDILTAMRSHAGEAAVCCHRDTSAPEDQQYETLSTVILDLARGEMTVLDGGPCGHVHN